MSSSRASIIILIFLFAMINSCSKFSSEIYTGKKELEQINVDYPTIELAILYASNKYHWETEKVKDGKIVITYHRGNVMAKAAVIYNRSFYEIQHLASDKLNYDPQNNEISIKYNLWISKLSGEIYNALQDPSILNSVPNNLATISYGKPSFVIQKNYEYCFEKILRHMKIKGLIIDAASKEVGQIIAELGIKRHGMKETLSKCVVSIIENDDGKTNVIVSVHEQQRYNALKIEEWQASRVNKGKSVELAEELKEVLLKGSNEQAVTR